MKLIKTSILVLVVTLLSLTDTNAQHTSFTFTYNMAQPTGESHEWIGKFSPRGFSAEYEIYLNDNLSMGASIGWQVFYRKITGESYEIDQHTQLYGAQFRYTNSVPMNITTKYYFNPGGSVEPFIGVGLGTMYVVRRLDMGPFRFNEKGWGFLVYPEAGIKVPTDGGWNFHLAATYHYMPSTGKLEIEQSFVGFKLGMSWDYRRY